ncbi:MAG: S41 family peptidase [Cytophagales bacterium]|nr:S41 family peptidase [Cytophagales bacterium]
MRKLLVAIYALTTFQLNAQSEPQTLFDQKFSSDELLEDFMVFREGLEKLHPGLYRYTRKRIMDSLFNHMQNNLHNKRSYQEFYRDVCALLAKIKCQHTVATPDSEILNHITKKGEFFPLSVLWEFDTLKAYVAFDLSTETILLPGTRIRSINSRSIEEIYSFLIPLLPSDGNILTNKHSRLQYGVDFQLWYYLLIDRPEEFIVELENSNGEVFTQTYSAVTFKKWVKNYKRYRSQKDPEVRKYTDYYVALENKNRSQPIRYEYISEDIALLHVGNFHSPQFEQLVSEAFTAFHKDDIKDLIIDVRYNEGGSDVLGRFLFSYLIKKPTIYFDSLYTATGVIDTTFLYTYTDKNTGWWKKNRSLVYKMADGRYATKPIVNKGLEIQVPREHSFQGNVYIIMNGRSASTTAEFTAAVHINKLAIFIGEESGGAYHGGNGGDFASLKLPNSKIVVNIPLSKYVMNSTEIRFTENGTLPDYEVQTYMQDILDLKDPQLEFALRLINKQKN